MSTMRQDHTKIVLPRTGPDQFWAAVHKHYAGDDRRKWKYLGMLALRENAGWRLDHIGKVFGHRRGHVIRCLDSVKEELRQHFRESPDFLERSDDEP